MATPPQPGQGMPIPMPGPGQRPTPEQIQQIQRQLAMDAEKAGMTVPEFIEHIKKQAREQQMRMRQAQQQGGHAQHEHGPNCNHDHSHSHGEPQPITPGPPKPAALALAKFLRSQDLKPRTCILNGERKDMFKVKRALRALQTPAYEKARKKNPLLPEITDRASLENAFKLLPLSMLALRVTKIEPEAGPNGKKAKRVKGQWNVRIEQQQEAKEEMYYAWLWEGSQMKRQLYALLAIVAIFAIVLYPLWPTKMQRGVYYVSWGLLCLLGLFFLMAIFRVILFCITYFVVPPGLWLFPNLWEDVSFVDSFIPFWAWHSTEKPKKKKKAKAASGVPLNPALAAATGAAQPSEAGQGQVTQRQYMAPQVEEEDE